MTSPSGACGHELMAPPLYSIIIPAYNEEQWLPRSLAAAKEAMAAITEPGEIVVADNLSTDRTAQLAADSGATVVPEPTRQISRVRNTGARHARGRLLFFVDADTIISPELLREALHRLGRDAGGGATVTMDSYRQPLSAIGIRCWNWLSITFNLAAGCFMYCRRDAFETVGGFSERVYAGEEIWFSLALRRWAKKHGRRFAIITAWPVVTSSRKLDWHSPVKQIGLVLFFSLFPLATRFRSFCAFWYRRPADREPPDQNNGG